MPTRRRGAASRRWRPPTGERRGRRRSAAATPVSRAGGLRDRPAGALRLREHLVDALPRADVPGEGHAAEAAALRVDADVGRLLVPREAPRDRRGLTDVV